MFHGRFMSSDLCSGSQNWLFMKCCHTAGCRLSACMTKQHWALLYTPFKLSTSKKSKLNCFLGKKKKRKKNWTFMRHHRAAARLQGKFSQLQCWQGMRMTTSKATWLELTLCTLPAQAVCISPDCWLRYLYTLVWRRVSCRRALVIVFGFCILIGRSSCSSYNHCDIWQRKIVKYWAIRTSLRPDRYSSVTSVLLVARNLIENLVPRNLQQLSDLIGTGAGKVENSVVWSLLLILQSALIQYNLEQGVSLDCPISLQQLNFS